MSTGLSVLSATYGIRATVVDVTNAVAALVKDGSLKFTVSPTTLNVDDPAPGQLKMINITYSINGGSSNTLTKNDNDLVSIDAPPATIASGLQIVKGEYGYTGNFTDVTDSLQSQINNGSINIVVGFKAVGIPDPNPNKQKELKVEYTINGKKSADTFKDGQRFKVSAPPVEGKTNSKASENVGSFFWMFVMNGLHAISIMLLVTCMYGGYDLASQIPKLIFPANSSYLPSLNNAFGYIGFFVCAIPIAGYVGLWILTFFISLFAGRFITITPPPMPVIMQ